MRRGRPPIRPRTRAVRSTLWGLWQSGGLVALGLLAAGMTAFPAQTLSLLGPVAGALGGAWRAGLGATAALRESGASGLRAARGLAAVGREARELERQIAALEQRTILKEEQQRELVRLRRLLQLKEEVTGPAVSARVIGSDPGASFRTLVLDLGVRDGVREGNAVVAAAGAVGRILSAGADHAVALWLCDPRSRIAGFVQRSRAMGVLTGEGEGCSLRYLAAGDDVRVGDRVLTAGHGSAFPKGILIGVVKDIHLDGMLMTAEIAPAVNVRRLEEVLVLPRGE